MARKLKTYQTSLGFFDMAIAAPSMKAALEAWGSKSNLFHQGFAREVDDPDVIAATIAKPGVILRRPVGSDGPFKEDAELPSDLSRDKVKGRPEKHRAKPVKRSPRKIGDQAARKAALAYEKEQKQRESQRRREAAARAKEQERREQAIAKAQAAIDEAQQAHEQKAGKIDTERAALEERAQAEEARWKKQKEKLAIALRRARG
jgi:colicin import membrane protein